MSQLLFDENQIFFFLTLAPVVGRNLKIFGAGDWYTTPGSDILWGGAVTAINKITITNKSFIYVSVYIFCDLCVIIIQNFLFTLNFKINLSSSSSKKKSIVLLTVEE